MTTVCSTNSSTQMKKTGKVSSLAENKNQQSHSCNRLIR